jgi:hypothetical protein
MNDKLIQIGLDSGMLNYVDNETPRHYFIASWADEDCLKEYTEMIIRECIGIIHEQERSPQGFLYPKNAVTLSYAIQTHFGLTE